MLLAASARLAWPSLYDTTFRCATPSLCAQDDMASIESAMLRWHTPEAEPQLQTHAVAEVDDGERVVRVAGRHFAALGSKSQASAAVKRRALLLNGAAVETSRRVRVGDMLTLEEAPKAAPSASKLQALSRFVGHLRTQGLRTPYEDAHLAIVYKPPGIHTKSGTNRKYAALEDALPAELSPPLAKSVGPQDALPLPLVMHRLDVPVSGLCVVAKTRSAALHLARQFEERRVHKSYHALLVGTPKTDAEGKLTIRAPVDGLESHTELEVLRTTPHPQWGALTTVRLSPKTGRTHQLRVHAASELGCPIVGDDLYWEAAADMRASLGQTLPALRKGGGLFLQSTCVSLEHPIDGGVLQVMVGEAGKFGALRARARSGAEWTAE